MDPAREIVLAWEHINFDPESGLWKVLERRVLTITPSSSPRQDGMRNNVVSPLIAKDCGLQNGSDIYSRISVENVQVSGPQPPG